MNYRSRIFIRRFMLHCFLRNFLPKLCNNFLCLIKFYNFTTAGLRLRYFLDNSKNISKIRALQEILEMLFTRKRFCMCVYYGKWLSCRGRHVGIKLEELSALHVERELSGKSRKSLDFIKDCSVGSFLQLLALPSCF